MKDRPTRPEFPRDKRRRSRFANLRRCKRTGNVNSKQRRQPDHAPPGRKLANMHTYVASHQEGEEFLEGSAEFPSLLGWWSVGKAVRDWLSPLAVGDLRSVVQEPARVLPWMDTDYASPTASSPTRTAPARSSAGSSCHRVFPRCHQPPPPGGQGPTPDC